MKCELTEAYNPLLLLCIIKGLMCQLRWVTGSLNEDITNMTSQITIATSQQSQDLLNSTILNSYISSINSALQGRSKDDRTALQGRSKDDRKAFPDSLVIPTHASGVVWANISAVSSARKHDDRHKTTPREGNVSANNKTLRETGLMANHETYNHTQIAKTESQKAFDGISQNLVTSLLTNEKQVVTSYQSGTPTVNTSSSYTLFSDKVLKTTLWTSYKRTTHRPIYIRGHRVQASQSFSKNSFDNSVKSPASMISKHGYPTHHVKSGSSADELSDSLLSQGHNSTGSKTKKRKFFRRTRIDSSIKDPAIHKSRNASRVYGWIIGAAMLSVGSLVTLTAGVLLCFCGEKIRKRRQERKRQDKYGEYQRVESVSSLVSSTYPNDTHDDHIETVSMI